MTEFYPGFVSMAWQGIVAPKGTPKEITHKLSDAIVEALKSPDVVEKLAASNVNILGSAPEEFGTFIRQERERWGHVIAKAKITFQ